MRVPSGGSKRMDELEVDDFILSSARDKVQLEGRENSLDSICESERMAAPSITRNGSIH